jgi:D-alanine--poly(phosphoribitol) ligase, subunit 2
MEQRIMEILNDICGAQPGELEPDMDLFEAGLLDSFGVVQLLVALEEQLQVVLDIESISREEIATPAKLIRRAEAGK